MKRVHEVRCFLLTTLVGGCVGTIDDPNLYQGGSYSASARPDASRNGAQDEDESESVEAQDELDAGRPGQNAAARDAGYAEAAAPWPPSSMDSAVSDAAGRWSSDVSVAEAAAVEAAASDAAAASADAGSAAPDAAAACDFRALMASKCGNSGCHGGPAVSTGLDLTSDKLATRVAGRKASGACASYFLIDSEQPERSALYLKVTADACGSRMPLGGTLTDSEQTCILQWITNL